MEKQKTKSLFSRQLKRIGTIALATTIALSFPAVSNVASKVSPINSSVVSAAEEQTNLMFRAGSQFVVTHNESDEHWTHTFINESSMEVDSLDFNLTDLTYVVKFPDALSHLLEDEYVLNYLFGNVTNFDATVNPFKVTGHVIDENDEQITIATDTHKPYEHISINKETNSIEFDFNSFYTANNLKPSIGPSNLVPDDKYLFENLDFHTPMIVPDSRMLDNGTYEFKSAIVRGTSIDLDNVPNAYSENLVVDYSTDPEPEPEEPEVDKDELESLIEEATGYDADEYTEESFAVLSVALAAADIVFADEDATEEEVEGAVEELQEAIDGLVEVGPEEPEEVDTEALEALIAEAETYSSEDYTEESFFALTNALAVAEEVLLDEDATQDDVNEALAALQTAVDELVPVEGEDPALDTEALEALITEAEGYDANNYTDASFATLSAAVEEAEVVLADENATQDEVDHALNALQAAIDGLEVVEEPEDPEEEPEAVDTTDLEAALNNAEDYNASDYTKASFAALTTAVTAAEEVLINESATQEDVDTALAAVNAAIDGLVEVETEDPAIEDEEKDETETPKIEGDGSEDGEGDLLPKTATSTFNIMVAGFLVLIAGAGSLFIAKRRFN